MLGNSLEFVNLCAEAAILIETGCSGWGLLQPATDAGFVAEVGFAEFALEVRFFAGYDAVADDDIKRHKRY